jgi:putative oxidoreductase
VATVGRGYPPSGAATVSAMSKGTPKKIPVDAAALGLRLTIGPMLFVHGYNKVFGAGGLDGTTRWFEGLGLAP